MITASRFRPTREPVPLLLTVRELDHGGIERDVTKIALNIDKSRFEPHVASYFTRGARYEELRRAGIPILHLPVRSLVSKTAITSAFRLCSYIRKHRIRLVHSYDPSAVFAVPLARMCNVPVVLSSQLGSRDLHDRRTRKELRFTDRMVDCIIVNCEALKDHLVRDENIAAERIEICYNGVDTGEFYFVDCPKPAAVLGASIVIGTVSVLRPEKALEVLLEAFAKVRHLQPGTKLLIVGSGPELQKLQAASVHLGIADETIFLPAQSSVAALFRSIDIFVNTSNNEAFSNALLEAMACGCCVVGSRVGGTPELIADGDRGLLFASGDAEELAQKLSLLIGNERLRKAIAKKAAQFAATELSVQRVVDRTMEIYDTHLSQSHYSTSMINSAKSSGGAGTRVLEP